MPENIVGKIPEFTTDETIEGQEGNEVVEEVVEEGQAETEKPETEEETDTTPGETPEQEPASVAEEPTSDDTENERAVQGLLQERTKLLTEISELKGQRRELKKEELVVVNQKLDDLKDVNPQDVELIDKVLRSKGYVTKAEAQTMFYDSVKQDAMAKFLEKYPEYKPENDPNDLNWSRLNSELSYFGLPKDPNKIVDVLEKAHRLVLKIPSGRSPDVAKRQLEIAGTGRGGAQRPSSRPDGNRLQKAFESGQLQGWSEEEIREMQSNSE